jgi:DNA-binding HxlR family transcriptional regulator
MPVAKELPAVLAERALKVIGGRWKVYVLYYLFGGTKRLSELRRLIPGVSQKVLVPSLRELEAHGIVRRKVFAEVPPRVEYLATRLGLTLRPIVASLCAWGGRHAGALDHRRGPQAEESALGQGGAGGPNKRRPRASG